MQLNFEGIGDRIGIPIELKNAMKAPKSQATPNRLYTKIRMPETYSGIITPEGLRNGQMIGARESLAEVLERNREAERLERENNYHKLADILRGYYAFDTDELKEGRDQLRREINLESTRQLIKEVIKDSPDGVINVEDIEFKENRPVPRTITTFTPAEEQLLHNILQKADEDGIELTMAEKRNITRMTPALSSALQNGYKSWKSYNSALGGFSRLGPNVFTEELKEQIRAKTQENINAAAPAAPATPAAPTGSAFLARFFRQPVRGYGLKELEGEEGRTREDTPDNIALPEFATAMRDDPRTGERGPPQMRREDAATREEYTQYLRQTNEGRLRSIRKAAKAAEEAAAGAGAAGAAEALLRIRVGPRSILGSSAAPATPRPDERP